jgi:hypothetical protein
VVPLVVQLFVDPFKIQMAMMISMTCRHSVLLQSIKTQIINSKLVAVRIPRVARKGVRCPRSRAYRPFVWRARCQSGTVKRVNRAGVIDSQSVKRLKVGGLRAVTRARRSKVASVISLSTRLV